MTVSEIRKLMQERIIPESVLPDNISVFLSDEEIIPELDTYTFLNRLRSLGIGSADFLYLLKGCGAPDDAIKKIEERPDMDLQSLIITLNNSGLTPKDYTRMLYTARQLWEHTITMRLDHEQTMPEASENDKATDSIAKKDTASGDTADIPHEPKAAPVQSKVRTAKQRKKDSEPEFVEYTGVRPIGRAGRQSEKEEPKTDEADNAAQLQVNAEPDDEKISENNQHTSGASRAGIAAAAVGASILCVINAGMYFMGIEPDYSEKKSVHFAEDNQEIFSEIYTAYSSDKIGGSIQPMTDASQIFGELLVNSGEELGAYTFEHCVWAAEPEKITVYDISVTTQITAEIEPPEGTEFIAVHQTDDKITAIFSGDNLCGLTGIDFSGEAWKTIQCGELTDYFFDEDIIRLGSVYIPEYENNFTIDDTSVYLPWIYSGASSIFSADEIAVSGTGQGISYAVWAEYSAQNGDIQNKAAVLGDPLFSGAEYFSAVVRQEASAQLITLNEENKLISTTADIIDACAISNETIALAGTTDGSTVVTLLDRSLKAVGAFSADGNFDSMRIDGNAVLMCNDNTVISSADITDPAAPQALKLTAVSGKISGEYALCSSLESTGINITLFKLMDGKAVKTDSFTKAFTEAELKTLKFMGINSALISENCFGMAYRWFDGVSIVDEFAEFGKSRSLHTMYDNSNAYHAAVFSKDKLVLI